MENVINNLSVSKHYLHKTRFLVAIRIFVSIGFIDTLYFVLIIFSLFGEILDQYEQSLIFIGFTLAFLALFILQTLMILFILLRWATDEYYISEHQLFHYQGLTHVEEHVYELKHIKTVKLHQSFFGKIFNYGDITIHMGAHGYSETLKLREFSNPKLYERIFRDLIKG